MILRSTYLAKRPLYWSCLFSFPYCMIKFSFLAITSKDDLNMSLIIVFLSMLYVGYSRVTDFICLKLNTTFV